MGNLFSNPGQWLISLVYSLPGILLGLVLHEFSHAAMATRLGDPTPRLMGRLSLNPLHHLDPVGFLMLILAGFGWAKPVITNPAQYKIKRYGYALVGLAGPMMNLLLTVLLFFSFLALYYNGVLTENNFIMNVLYYAAFINAVLCVFNLIPVPPLDGYNILKDVFLIRVIKPQTLWNFERYGQFILIGLIIVSSRIGVNVIGTVAQKVLMGVDNLYRLIFHIL